MMRIFNNPSLRDEAVRKMLLASMIIGWCFTTTVFGFYTIQGRISQEVRDTLQDERIGAAQIAIADLMQVMKTQNESLNTLRSSYDSLNGAVKGFGGALIVIQALGIILQVKRK